MAKKRKAFVPPALPDGFYWYRNLINLRGGGHVDRWKMAQIVGGLVQRPGTESVIDVACPYLRDALWVRAEPPAMDARDTTAIRPATARRAGNRAGRVENDCGAEPGDRVRIVAQGIVDAFLETHESVGAHYRSRPDQKAELVAQIERLIARVQQ